jgi:hypothetical protein
MEKPDRDVQPSFHSVGISSDPLSGSFFQGYEVQDPGDPDLSNGPC